MVPPSFKQAGDYIIVPKGSSINTLADLRGKKVGVPFGSSAHGFLLNAVKSVGLSPSTVKFVNLAPRRSRRRSPAAASMRRDLEPPGNGRRREPARGSSPAGGRRSTRTSASTVGTDKDLTDPPEREAHRPARASRDAYQWGDAPSGQWIQDVEKETGVDAADREDRRRQREEPVRYVAPSSSSPSRRSQTASTRRSRSSKPVKVGRSSTTCCREPRDGGVTMPAANCTSMPSS